MKILILLAATMLSLNPAKAFPKHPLLSPLTSGRDYESGCGCTVLNGHGKALAVSGPDQSSPLLVKLDGKLLTLAFEKSNERDPRTSAAEKPGDIFTRTYSSAGSTRATLRFETTQVCSESEEDCEASHYRVDLDLSRPPGSLKLRALNALCGC